MMGLAIEQIQHGHSARVAEWWSYLLTGCGVAALLLTRWTPFFGGVVGLCSQGLWWVYGTATQQRGFSAGVVVFGLSYLVCILSSRPGRAFLRRVLSSRLGRVFLRCLLSSPAGRVFLRCVKARWSKEALSS
jgi:hypothetical protein